MEVSELISRKRGETDDRIINVTLTRKGKEAARFTAMVISQIEDDIRSQFSQEEVESLRTPGRNPQHTLGGLDPSI